jgi:hypothetical protein
VLTGYADRHYEIEKQKRDEAEKAADRQGRAFQALLNSDDEEMQAYAGAGILDLANPRKRKGGLAGWMGEIEQTPYLDIIRRAQQRPGDARGGTPPATPSIPTPAGSVAAPATGSLAQPSTSAVEGGPVTPATPAPTTQPGTPQPSAPPPQPPSVLGGPPPGATFGTPPPARPPMPAFPGPGGAPIPGAPSAFGADPRASFAPPPEAQAQAPGAAAPTGGPPSSGVSFMPPPQPPAGPPLPVSAAPPRPPGLIADGQSGATTGQVGRGVPVPPQRTTLRPIFPSSSDLARQEAVARSAGADEGEQQSWIRVAEAQGSPNPQADGLRMWAEAQMRTRAGAAATLREGNSRPLPDGTWVQDLYDAQTGKVVNSIPSLGPLAGGTVGNRDSVAYEMYGKQGEDPRETMRRIAPVQVARVNEELRHRQALQAAEVALARAEALHDAPLTAQATSQLIEVLNTKWLRLQQPLREMARQFTLMQTGLKRFQEGDRIGGAQDILITFQKMLDPTSVVRESEYARTAEGLGLIQRLEGGWEKLKAGGAGVPVEDMAAMVETSRQFLENMKGWNDNERGRIEDRANAHGIDPGFIFGGGVKAPVTPPPAAGGGGKPVTGGVSLDSEYEKLPDGTYRIKRP